jgi:hypothetical protein
VKCYPWCEMENCAVCHEPLACDTETINCKHVFHKECITEWARYSTCHGNEFPCPLCRTPHPVLQPIRISARAGPVLQPGEDLTHPYGYPGETISFHVTAGETPEFRISSHEYQESLPPTPPPSVLYSVDRDEPDAEPAYQAVLRHIQLAATSGETFEFRVSARDEHVGSEGFMRQLERANAIASQPPVLPQVNLQRRSRSAGRAERRAQRQARRR